MTFRDNLVDAQKSLENFMASEDMLPGIQMGCIIYYIHTEAIMVSSRGQQFRI